MRNQFKCSLSRSLEESSVQKLTKRLQFFKLVVSLLLLSSASHVLEGNIISNEEKVLTILDLAEKSVAKAKSLFPDCDESVASNQFKRETSLRFLDFTRKKIVEAQNLFPVCDNVTSRKAFEKPVDCSEVLANGNTENGIYTIWPRNRLMNGKLLEVFCDMETDGGGWTVIQRRGNYSDQQNFYHDWEQYKIGFGNVDKDFWLGNDYIHAVTNQAEYEIRFDLLDTNGEQGFAQYSTFWIDGEDSSYTLHISNYSGNAGDCMKHHNNMKFSTKDRGSTQFARFYKGGWWYHDWAHSNLNGRFKPGKDSVDSVHWWYWRQNRNLAGVEIKVRAR